MNRASNAILALGLLGAACASDRLTAPSGEPIQVAWVTPELRSSIGPDGRFIYPPRMGDPGEISPAALDLMLPALDHLVKTSVGNLREALEEDRGAPIRWDAVHHCGRPFIADGLYQHLPDVPVLATFRNAWDSRWEVQFCEGDSAPVANVEVAARSGLHVEDGKLQFECYGTISKICVGNELYYFGITAGPHVGDLTPEFAAARIYYASGVPVADLPVAEKFVEATGPFQPTIGHRWRIRLARPVTIQRARRSGLDTTSVLYYVPRCGPGSSSCILAAAHIQPGPQSFTLDVVDPTSRRDTTVSFSLIPVRPLVLDTVVVVR